MRAEARKYLTVETTSSFVVNALLNYGPANLIFRNHPVVAMSGKGGMLQDSIGETFIVAFLSYLVPSLIARSRRTTGKLPVSGIESKPQGNPYLRSLAVAAVFTAVLTGLNFLLLPKIFGDSVTLHTELMFKTFYGAVFGALASFLAIHRALQTVVAVPGKP